MTSPMSNGDGWRGGTEARAPRVVASMSSMHRLELLPASPR